MDLEKEFDQLTAEQIAELQVQFQLDFMVAKNNGNGKKSQVYFQKDVINQDFTTVDQSEINFQSKSKWLEQLTVNAETLLPKGIF